MDIIRFSTIGSTSGCSRKFTVVHAEEGARKSYSHLAIEASTLHVRPPAGFRRLRWTSTGLA